MIRLAIRGFIAGAKVLEEFADVTEDGEGDGMVEIAERQATLLMSLPGGDRHMIEIEFLDEPNPRGRFFRIGTDPRGMVKPIAIPIGGGDVGKWN